MNFELTEETLEEGRVALHALERQLNARNAFNDNSSATSSKVQSTISDRKILDQIPRNARLNNRESLGLTVEELEDRGLLEGGGAVPNYYTSMKQKGRRVMELQPRSHRLQERGKEALTKVLNGLMHMIRILVRRGLKMEEFCRQRDTSQRGLMARKEFHYMLKSLGLPFSARELHDVAQHYVVPSSEHVDYVTFLKDARVLRSGGKFDLDLDKGKAPVDIGKRMTVLVTVKRMLSESLRGLSKDPDDVYRMFARWDTDGTGTVTATQFLRVLAKLHINLNEDDQDFLVELLDTNAMGRIDFEGLLSYCFSGGDHEIHGTVSHDNFEDTLSAVSTEGGVSVEQKSLPSLTRRPHTATVSRPFNENNHLLVGPNGVYMGHAGTAGQTAGNRSPLRSAQVTERVGTADRSGRVRPLTASGARAPPAPEHALQRQHSSGSGGPNVLTSGGQSLKHQRSIQRQQDYENQNYVKELPDDVINDEELDGNGQVAASIQGNAPLSPRNDYSEMNSLPQRGHLHHHHHHQQHLLDTHDGAGSFNDTTQLTEHDAGYQRRAQQPTIVVEPRGKADEPSDHLVLLANQILTALREIIMTRYRRGKSLQEIFMHFDRESKAYFDAVDFVRATSDLRIETSERVAAIAVRQIALDGVTTVTFGEFKVFVLDSDHKLLELNIQEQLANLLEQEGREYKQWMVDTFWNEESGLNDSKVEQSPDDRETGMISRQAFVTGLQKIGAMLTASEVGRLVDRFDLYSQGMCSLARFVRMVQTSQAWRRAEQLLAYMDEAVEEARLLRHQLRTGGPREGFPDLSEELISISEYLGIRVLSEQHMLWIASDALKAPLPVSWVAKRDKEGRTYFFNSLTNQARWEHPLDPHFRKLRDKYRQSEPDEQAPFERNSSSGGLHQMLPSARPHVNNFSVPLATPAAHTSKPLVLPSAPSDRKKQTYTDPEITYNPGDRNVQSATRSGPQGKTDSNNFGGGRNRPVSAPHHPPSDQHKAFVAPSLQRNNSSKGINGPSQAETNRAIMEQVYTTPFLKTPNVTSAQSNRLFGPDDKSANLMSSGFVSSQQNPSTQRARPTSSSQRRAAPAPTSAVDRALGVGKNTPNYLLPKGGDKERLAEARNAYQGDAKFLKLFEVDVIDRLDDILHHHYQPKN